MTYDARFIANWVLDEADQTGRPLTNIDLNKIVFFLNSHYLSASEKPLIDDRIEAWHYGPVITEIYRQFKHLRREYINIRAMAINLNSGVKEPVYEEFAEEDLEILRPALRSLLSQGTWNLVEISHESGGAWDAVYNSNPGENPGMRIDINQLSLAIRNRVRH